MERSLGERALFDFHAYWLGGFKRTDKRKPKDLYLQTRFDGPTPFAVHVQGRWWRKSSIEANMIDEAGRAGFVGPRAETVHKQTGRVQGFFLLAPPSSPFADHVLAVTIDRTAVPSGADVPTMLLLGGYAPEGSLAFIYPCGENREAKA